MFVTNLYIHFHLLVVISHIVPTDAHGFLTYKVNVSVLTLGGLVARKKFNIQCYL